MVNECLRGNAIMFDPFRAKRKEKHGREEEEEEWKEGILTIETETMQEKRHTADPASVTVILLEILMGHRLTFRSFIIFFFSRWLFGAPFQPTSKYGEIDAFLEISFWWDFVAFAVWVVLLLLLLPMYLLSFKEVYVYVQAVPFFFVGFCGAFLVCMFSLAHWHCKSAFGGAAGFLLLLMQFRCAVVFFVRFSLEPMLSLTVRDISLELKFREQIHKKNGMTCICIHSRFCTWKPKAREN